MKTIAFGQALPDPSKPNTPGFGWRLLFPSKEIIPEFTPSDSRQCLLGNSSARTFADQMDKTTLTSQDSFLKKYREHLALKSSTVYLREFQTPNYINKEQILCAMKRIPYVSQRKRSCRSSNENGRVESVTPCITDQMVEYVHWGLNEAFKCYGNLLDSHERRMIFKKINHESAFGFFFQYSGGAGIAQLIGESKRDLFLPGYSGNNFLRRQIISNAKSCESFLQLLNRTLQERSLKSCEFISIGDGIGRSLIGGIGLYLHYRSDPNNPYSAERLLERWGYTKRNTESYKLIRSYITLGMYNKGPGAVLNAYKNAFPKGSLAKKSESDIYKSIMGLIKRSHFYGYVRSIERDTERILDQDGNCKI